MVQMKPALLFQQTKKVRLINSIESAWINSEGLHDCCNK